jgi:hypothetical protein
MQGPNFCLEPNNESYIPIPTLKTYSSTISFEIWLIDKLSQNLAKKKSTTIKGMYYNTRIPLLTLCVIMWKIQIVHMSLKPWRRNLKNDSLVESFDISYCTKFIIVQLGLIQCKKVIFKVDSFHIHLHHLIFVNSSFWVIYLICSTPNMSSYTNIWTY